MNLILHHRSLRRRLRRAAGIGVCCFLASCISAPTDPIMSPMKISKTEERALEIPKSSAAARDRLTSSPAPALAPVRAATAPTQTSQPPSIQGEPISVNFEAVRLPAVINTVFGDLLKVPFEIDSAVMKRDVVVTLRNPEPLSPNQFYRLVTEVLGNYGITVLYSNNIYRIVEAASTKPSAPRIIRSRSAAGTPGDMRPVFHFMSVNTVSANNMITWLGMAFNDRIRPVLIPNSNGLLLLGNAEDVEAAVDTIQTLDANQERELRLKTHVKRNTPGAS